LSRRFRIGLALNCSITPWGRFARKNYFYPDQPKNYQISQYDEPIATNGHLEVVLDDGSVFRVEIERAHMEEDTVSRCTSAARPDVSRARAIHCWTTTAPGCR